MEKKEMVNHPSHYNKGSIEVIDVIYDWKLDFDLGNALKYIARAGNKESGSLSQNEKTIEDLNKAIWYLEHKTRIIEENNYPYMVPLIKKYNEREVIADWCLPELLGKAVVFISLISNSDTWKTAISGAITSVEYYIKELRSEKFTVTDIRNKILDTAKEV